MNLHGFIFSWRSVSPNDNAIESKYPNINQFYSRIHFLTESLDRIKWKLLTLNSCLHFLVWFIFIFLSDKN